MILKIALKKIFSINKISLVIFHMIKAEKFKKNILSNYLKLVGLK